MENEIKVVAYARVSSKEQAEKELSIPAQLEAIRNYCKQKGWKLVHEYIDAGKSAKTDERPEFQRMVAMAKRPNKGFEAIIVHKIDRFSRNRDDHVIYKALLKKLGVTVYSLTEQADPETPHGFLLEGIIEVISEFYNMNLKNETMKGMRENAVRGYHNGGQAPYGYRTNAIKDAKGRTRTIWVLGPDEEVNTIRRIYDLYVRHNKGYKAIVYQLNEEGIPSPKGKLWSWTTVWHILHNEAYIGQKVWNKHDYGIGKKKKPHEEWIISANAQPAIIDRDTFNTVIQKSKERNYSEGAFKATGPSLYILRGLLICPECGVRMVTGSNSKNARGKTRYYHCGTYHRKGPKACNRNTVYKDIIESALINELIREFSILCYPGSLEEEIKKYYEYKNKDTLFQLARTEDEIIRQKQRIDAVLKEKSTGEQNKYLKEYIIQLKDDISKLENEREKLKAISTVLDLTNIDIKGVRENLKAFASSFKTMPPDQQYLTLKDFVQVIVEDRIANSFKLTCKITGLDNLSGDKKILLEKPIYFSL